MHVDDLFDVRTHAAPCICYFTFLTSFLYGRNAYILHIAHTFYVIQSPQFLQKSTMHRRVNQCTGQRYVYHRPFRKRYCTCIRLVDQQVSTEYLQCIPRIPQRNLCIPVVLHNLQVLGITQPKRISLLLQKRGLALSTARGKQQDHKYYMGR